MTYQLVPPGEASIRKTIAEHLPHLAREPVESLGAGWAFWAFRAGDTVLRFPRDVEFTQSLAVEAAVMREMAPALPLPVSVIDVHADGPNGLPFTSHRLVPGVPVGDLGRPLAPDAGAELGRFVRAMHAFPVERAEGLSLVSPAPAERSASLQRFFEDAIVVRVLPLLSEDAALHVRTTFETFLASPANFEWPGVVSHADIDDRNVLADPATGRLTGVIDWGDIRIGDPAGDFTSVLYGALGNAGLRGQLPDLLDACGMTPAEIESMRPRCRFYEYCWPFYDVLYGLDSHDDAIVERGIALLGEAVDIHRARSDA